MDGVASGTSNRIYIDKNAGVILNGETLHVVLSAIAPGEELVAMNFHELRT